MRILSGQLIVPLVVLCITLSSFAQELPSEDEHVESSGIPKLDGKSFQGRIRGEGMLGLFSVRGTLSFKDGLLIWEAKDSEVSAPYEEEDMDGILKFTSRVPGEGGTYVDWSGTYDGESVSGVKAIWTRIEEEDFIHDLFLPDVVTLVFITEKD